MTRMKCVAGLAIVMIAGFYTVRCGEAAERRLPQPSVSSGQWDDLGPSSREVAMADPDDAGPPGPPPDGDDDRPRPPRGPDADRGGPRPPSDQFGPPSGRDRGPGGDRRPRGEPRDRDFDRPLPGRDRGPDADHRPPGPPSDGDRNRMPPRHEGGPDGNRQPPGPPREQERLERLEKADPEMFKLLKEDRELERKTHELVMQYRRAASEERDKIKQQVEEAVSKHFDVRQQRRALELKRLESELQRLREAVDRRAKARKELIDKRVSDLVGREDDLRF